MLFLIRLLQNNINQSLGVSLTRSPSFGRKISSPSNVMSSRRSTASITKFLKTADITDFSSSSANFCPIPAKQKSFHRICIETWCDEKIPNEWLTVSGTSAEWNVGKRIATVTILLQKIVRIELFWFWKYFWITMQHIGRNETCCSGWNCVFAYFFEATKNVTKFTSKGMTCDSKQNKTHPKRHLRANVDR